MLRAIRYAVTSWRFGRFTRHLDRAIRDARKRHAPTAHLIAAKREFVHDALRAAAQRDRTARTARPHEGGVPHGA